MIPKPYTLPTFEPAPKEDATASDRRLAEALGGDPNHEHDYAGMYGDEWAGTVMQYEATPEDFYWAHEYIRTHPIFWRTSTGYAKNLKARSGIFRLDVNVMKVDPKTHAIDTEEWSNNTHTEVWLECGPTVNLVGSEGISSHDIYLDTGGATYEEAIVSLAGLIHERYGNDRTLVESRFGYE